MSDGKSRRSIEVFWLEDEVCKVAKSFALSQLGILLDGPSFISFLTDGIGMGGLIGFLFVCLRSAKAL